MVRDIVWHSESLAGRELEELPVGSLLVARLWDAPRWWSVSERVEGESWCAAFEQIARFRSQAAAIEWSRTQ
jgi:hypothetical protein